MTDDLQPEIDEVPLWGEQTEAALGALSFSGLELGSLPRLASAFGWVKVAAARANGSAGVLDPAMVEAISQAARSLAFGRYDAHLVVDPLAGGGGIAVHQNVNEVIASVASELLGSAVGAQVHVAASQSTADVCHTAARLALIDAAADLDDVVADLVAALRAAAERFDGVPTLARTCLQDATEVPARMLFDGAADALARRRQVLVAAVAPLHQVVLGSTVVGDGTGAPAAYRAVVVAELADVTGTPLVGHPSPASALQHGDDLVDLSGSVLALAVVAAKVAQDLRLLGSGPAGGLGELVLPKVIEGSTFFVAKNNPVVPETVIQAALQVTGRDATVRAAAARAELNLHGYDLTAGVSVLESIDMANRALALLRVHVIDGLALDEARCRELAALAASHKDASA